MLKQFIDNKTRSLYNKKMSYETVAYMGWLKHAYLWARPPENECVCLTNQKPASSRASFSASM
jgi:hypothetical protein